MNTENEQTKTAIVVFAVLVLMAITFLRSPEFVAWLTKMLGG